MELKDFQADMFSEAMRKQAEEVQSVFVASVRKILKQNKIRHKDFAKVLGMNLNSFERKMNHSGTIGFRLDEALRIAHELAESVEDLARGNVCMKETIYIAGAITGNSDYRSNFQKAENHLKENGFEKILNPTVLPDNLEHEQYMKICFSMIDVSDTVYFLRNWRDSDGATREYYYAMSQNKKIIFEGVF